MMNASWNLSNDAAQYKSYEKGWGADMTDKSAIQSRPQTASGYQRKNNDPDGNPTQRSGMISNDNPFGHMTRYYEK